jgi:hypothetical protein
MRFRELVFGRRSEFPKLVKATGFDFLLFPDDIDASMFTKMALKNTVAIMTNNNTAYEPIGGIIVFSTAVESIPKFFAQWGPIGRYFRGHYRSQNGSTFDETSLGLEVFSFTTGMLLIFSTMLANGLDQQTILVKDHSNDRIYLVDKRPNSFIDLIKISPRSLLSR